jgi:hypothetical protein
MGRSRSGRESRLSSSDEPRSQDSQHAGHEIQQRGVDRLWRERHAPDSHPPIAVPAAKNGSSTGSDPYACDSCGKRLHPMKGTILGKIYIDKNSEEETVKP